MRFNLVGAFIRNKPFGTELAFSEGLKRAGHIVKEIDPDHSLSIELNPAPDATIIFKWLDPGVLRDKIKTLPGKKILYQVDDLRFAHIKTMMVSMLDTCDHALTFDDNGAKLALSYGYKTARKLLLTADNKLYRHIPRMQKTIDICFVGSLTRGENHKSRVKMLDILAKRGGLKIAIASELFDIPKIVQLYNQSKIVLNHATDVGQPFGHGYGYQCRHFEAGFTKSLVLSNTIDNDNTIYFPTFYNEFDLLAEVDGWLHAGSLREDTAQNLYDDLYAHHLPEHRATEIVKFVESI